MLYEVITIVDLFNYSITVIMIGIIVGWIFLIKSMLKSFKETPYLERFEKIKHDYPKVSVILPARNRITSYNVCYTKLLRI